MHNIHDYNGLLRSFISLTDKQTSFLKPAVHYIYGWFSIADSFNIINTLDTNT